MSTGRRSISYGTPTEGVPERLMLKTPALRSRLGRTPGPAAGLTEAGMTPVEGVLERVIQRPPPTAVKPPPAVDAGPRVQPGLNAAPPVLSPERSGPGVCGHAQMAVLPSNLTASAEPAQLRSDSDSDGGDDLGYSDFGEDGARLQLRPCADLHSILTCYELV